jgi:hypothetical protein
MTVFSVAHKGIRLKVTLLRNVAEVDARYRDGRMHRAGELIHAFFQPTISPVAQHQGTIVLPLDGSLDELVPHEVAHAVIHCMRGVSANDDECAATAIGVLSAKIFNEVRKPSHQRNITMKGIAP